MPDPRTWPQVSCTEQNEPMRWALATRAGDSVAREKLTQQLVAWLDGVRDTEVKQLLAASPSPEIYRLLQRMIGEAIEYTSEQGHAVIARLFAIPLVMVCGAKSRVSVAGALHDVPAVAELLTEQGVLGASRNAGFSNVLCTLETIEQIPASVLRRWAVQPTESVRDIAGSSIVVEPGREQVHLRFLTGAAMMPVHAPSFLETASNIGAWGMALTKLLAQQLKQAGLDVLPIPRVPVALMLAPDAGRAAQLEISFNLFVSNTLRQFRMAVGDPTVILSAHRLAAGGAEIRVSFSSMLDESLFEGFGWPLYPADDHQEIMNKINNLLDECKVTDRLVCEQVLGDAAPRGSRFISVNDWPLQPATH